MKVSDRPFLDDVTSKEYVHAIVRVQVMVYVNDVDMSRVLVSIQGADSTKDSVTVSDSSRVSPYNVLESVKYVSVRVSVTSKDSSCVGTSETVFTALAEEE